MLSCLRVAATAAALALTIAGCVSSRVTQFDPTPIMNRRTPTDGIRFYETQPPRCAYKEIGHVTAKGGLFSSWGRVVNEVREKAHDLGGDAVISLRESSKITGAILSPSQISATETNSLSGTVVRFINPACHE